MKDLIKYWPIALFIFQCGLAWVIWSLRQVHQGDLAQTRETLRADDSRIEGEVRKLNSLHGKLEGRITAIERQVAELPTKADIARLEERVAGVGRGVENVDEAVLRLEGYFLRRGVEGVDR